MRGHVASFEHSFAASQILAGPEIANEAGDVLRDAMSSTCWAVTLGPRS